MTLYEQDDLDAERGAELGDPRRCPAHGCVTSSPDGMFDGPCGACEAEGYAAECAEDYTAEMIAARDVGAAEPTEPTDTPPPF